MLNRLGTRAFRVLLQERQQFLSLTDKPLPLLGSVGVALPEPQVTRLDVRLFAVAAEDLTGHRVFKLNQALRAAPFLDLRHGPCRERDVQRTERRRAGRDGSDIQRGRPKLLVGIGESDADACVLDRLE